MLFVRMLTIILQRMLRSIQTKEACPPVIIAASPVTFDPNVHSSRLRSQRSRQQELHQALYLSYDTSGSTASTSVCSYLSEWQIKQEQIKAPQEKAAEAH